MEVTPIIYPSGDPLLIETIVGQLKSQGTFDQFRKECVADVDTKPAYQNLHQRVEAAVAKFLEGQTWRPDMNKNQLRDSLRKHIHELGFLEAGVERIVDQVVNPKVHTIFMPQIEDVVYGVQGIPKPEKKSVPTVPASNLGSGTKNGGIFNSSLFSQPPPFLPGLSFLPPALQNHMQKPTPTLADLLPTDLDPVSPESSKESTDCTEQLKQSDVRKELDESLDSQLSGFSDLTSHGSEHGDGVRETENEVPNHQIDDEDSHLSKASSNSRTSVISSEEKSPVIKKLNRVDTDVSEENQHSIDTAVDKISESPSIQYSDNNCVKTPPLQRVEESVIHYEDQFSKEEEVATTVADPISETVAASEESLHYASAKDDVVRTDNVNDNDANFPKEDVPSNFCLNDEPDGMQTKPSANFPVYEAEDISVHHSEESQSSEASENPLQIDEMKDSNSYSVQSVQNFDQCVMKEPSNEEYESKDCIFEKSPSENIVEASEEARHGFDDSQDALERPLPPISCPLPQPSDSLSPKSNVSFSCEEIGIPRTPRWEPVSPDSVRSKVAAACAHVESTHFGVPQEDNNENPNYSANNLEAEDISQSGSEDMQLAWSPLSVNENKDEEDVQSKDLPEKSEVMTDFSEKREIVTLNDGQSEQQMYESKEHDMDIDFKTNMENDQPNDDYQEMSKSREKPRDERLKERSRNEDRSRKDSSSSFKKYDERYRHKDARERKDGNSRSKHDDRSRSDKERSSSHHKSDDKRKGDRERSSSSKHKSSRSEDRHRHRDRDSKSHSSAREDKDRGKLSSSKERSSSRHHSSDRDRRDRDKRDKEGRDKERRVDKERDRSGRDSSKHSEKRRDKEKEKKEKNGNACRPTNERRSPDPDSNNGSMFGGAQTTGVSTSSTSQLRDRSKEDNNKDASQTDSDSKSSDSSQSKDVCAELSSAPYAASPSPPSSLPFKKRPLHPDSSEVDESDGRLILRIKKAKLEPPYYHHQDTYNKRSIKTEKVSQSQEMANSDSVLKVTSFEEPSSPESSFLYFDNEWPTKSDDEAFCLFVKQLEQSETLSELSDDSASETEQEVHIKPSEFSITKSESDSSRLVRSLLSEGQANNFLSSQNDIRSASSYQKKGKVKQPRRHLNISHKSKIKMKGMHMDSERKELKFQKESVSEPIKDSPGLFKSRRERKPNKRYANEEFTSSFGYEDDETADENYTYLCSKSSDLGKQRKSCPEDDNRLTSLTDLNTSPEQQESDITHNDCNETSKNIGKQCNALVTSEGRAQMSPKAQESKNQRRESSHSWKRDEADSNSEDENDASGYENELIGTALKNLMMESGLGGPEEVSGPNNIPKTSSFSQKSTRGQPLSGVKRVGLSRNYKTKPNITAQTRNKTVSSKSPVEEFPLPPSPESDVSASSLEKGRMGKTKKAVLGVVVSDVQSNGDFGNTARKADRVKQHYNSDDLYKPRPLLRFTSKRRQVVAEHNESW